ncbi:peroxidase [Phlebotomus argentipes]|uniref:peroxidase n=1 Tax=Phlebotomus argentipes TaxID=94469 RepID=UPI0028929FBC|nr:peroxidase [Phlebotomus argentipes]
MKNFFTMASERTPLTTDIPPGPSYVFPRGFNTRARQRQIRQFQCCICATFMVIFIVALVITVSYTLTAGGGGPVDNSTSTPASFALENDTDTQSNITDGALDATTLEAFQVLLQLSWPIADESPDNWTLPEPTEKEIKESVSAGKKALGDKEILEEGIPSPDSGTPSFRHQKSIVSTPEARVITKRGFVENQATKDFLSRHNNATRSRRNSARRHSVGRGIPIDLGQPPIQLNCSRISHIYRTANGSCNNKDNPHFGESLTPFRRILNPDYADGVEEPRMSDDGTNLPSARRVSLEMHRPSFESDPKFTVMMAVWGQFLDHDITATALNQGQNGQPIDCCSQEAQQHPECFPVPIGKDDPYFDEYNVTCMGFVRSAPAPTGRFGPRQQLNQATAFIDGSAVYGSTNSRTWMLRERRGGRLRMFHTPDNRTLLPISTDPADGCNDAEQNAAGRYCFDTGDPRANENLLLTSMHLLWARHHNNLVEGLSSVNPNWTDEKLFQEGRKILGAQIQHITYSEFLPILLGWELCEHLNLLPSNKSEDTYRDDVDPTVANSFAAAAFRFSHNLLPGLMNSTRDGNTTESIHLHMMLFNPFSLWHPRGVDEAVASAVDTSLSRPNARFTTELTERLFESPMESRPQKPCGLDLVSLNIQRGRDHGLPGYPEWRRKCGLSRADSWQKMRGIMGPESVQRLQTLYQRPEDVDVYTGALLEKPTNDSLVGPVLLCMLGDQFVRLKEGDSFWYERTQGPQRFTPAQRNEIRKTTLAGIICANADAVDQAQKQVMRSVDDDNQIEDCDSLDSFDFTPWKENTFHGIKVNSGQAKVSAHHSKNRNVTKPLD